MSEQWRCVPGFDGYEVSDLGRVRSWWRKGTSNARRSEPRILPGWVSGRGYRKVEIGIKTYKTISVHVLVLEAFSGPRPAGMQASHLNGSRLDCRLANLVWETASENNRRKAQHGTWAGKSKLTPEDVSEIRRSVASGATKGSQAGKYGVRRAAISRIVSRRAWRHVA